MNVAAFGVPSTSSSDTGNKDGDQSQRVPSGEDGTLAVS
jgi:hypothetical protein